MLSALHVAYLNYFISIGLAKSISRIKPKSLAFHPFINNTNGLFTNSIVFSTKSTTNVATMLSHNSKIDLEPFCFKQFDQESSANFIPMEKNLFLNKTREMLLAGDCDINDGYAEFCKHIFVKNFTDAKLGILEITPENEHMLKSDYLRRTSRELPVLTRWFPLEKVQHFVKNADYLDIILYSREQIIKEKIAMGEMPENEALNDDLKADYYIISIIPLSDLNERPMVPITIMRNAIIEQGGSGVPIDEIKYMKSVEFWSKHAIIIRDNSKSQ